MFRHYELLSKLSSLRRRRPLFIHIGNRKRWDDEIVNACENSIKLLLGDVRQPYPRTDNVGHHLRNFRVIKPFREYDEHCLTRPWSRCGVPDPIHDKYWYWDQNTFANSTSNYGEASRFHHKRSNPRAFWVNSFRLELRDPCSEP